MAENKQWLSVANDIKALALINIQDIFNFVLTAEDADIEERYGTEERAIAVAEKYLEIARKVDIIEYSLKGWSMKYSQPVKGNTDERRTHEAHFYDKKEAEA